MGLRLFADAAQRDQLSGAGRVQLLVGDHIIGLDPDRLGCAVRAVVELDQHQVGHRNLAR